MKGRPPKANHLKVLDGARESRINRNEPQPSSPSENPPAAGGFEPPCDLSDGARAVWDRLAPDLEAQKVLTAWDLDSFAIFCEAVAIWHANKALMGDQYTARGAAGGVIKSPHWQIMRDAQATITQIGGRFGLTPADRAGLVIADSNDKPTSGGQRLLS